MKGFLAVLLATFLATAYGQTLNYKNLVPKTQCSTGLGSRIVGGKTAQPGFFPYQASLRKYGRHFCGGSIIGDKFILTAAHCLEGADDDEIKVYVGSTELHGDGATYQPEKVVYHEDYSSSWISNDIGIIKLTERIEFNNYTAAVALPSSDILKNKYPAIVSGWGRLSSGGEIPEKLQYLATCLLDQETCNEKVPSPVSEKKICAFTRYSQGACNGDSGGPLVADNSLVGVVSYAFYTCAYGYPDVYTRVYSYVDWIHEKMNSL